MSEIQFFDCCLNLTHDAFARDRDAVLRRAISKGLVGALICAVDLDDSARIPKIIDEYCRSHSFRSPHLKSLKKPHSAAADCPAEHHTADDFLPRLYGTAGVHPHAAKTWQQGHAAALRALAARQDCVAIGETGLDYARDFSPRDLQREVFIAQLELAAELQMPAFLHQRDAHTDFTEILSAYAEKLPGFVVHCFTGRASELSAYLELGAYIGITGWLCDERRGLHLRDLVATVPPEKLLVETDAPYLVPRSLKNRSARNEPAYLPHIIAALAAVLNTTVEHLAKQTTENSLRFIGIKKT